MSLSRSELYAVLSAEERVRNQLTPAQVLGGLTGTEVEWVCLARQWVPIMARQILRLQRDLTDERRRRIELEAAAADMEQTP